AKTSGPIHSLPHGDCRVILARIRTNPTQAQRQHRPMETINMQQRIANTSQLGREALDQGAGVLQTRRPCSAVPALRFTAFPSCSSLQSARASTRFGDDEVQMLRQKAVLFDSPHFVAPAYQAGALYRATPPLSHLALAGPLREAGYHVEIIDAKWDV